MKKNVLNLIVLLVAILMSSCGHSYGDNYTYKWEVAIVYTNGDKDTVSCEYDSFKGNKCFLYLKTSEPGILVDAPTSPCIVVGCGFYTKPVTCGVRQYIILSSDTIPLKIP